MITFNQIQKGTRIIINNEPHEVIEASHMFKGRGQSVLQTKIKNLIQGTVVTKTIRPSESFPEANISKFTAKFIYKHKDNFFFSSENNPSERFNITEEKIGSSARFLKEGEMVEGIIFKERIINITLPIKVQLRVTEAPPGIKGDRAQSGTKTIKLETNTEITAPLFIKEGDIVEINTQTGEYSKRI